MTRYQKNKEEVRQFAIDIRRCNRVYSSADLAFTGSNNH